MATRKGTVRQGSTALPTMRKTEEEKNHMGILGGLGYLGEKVGVGFMSSVEGIWDYTASGIATLFGNDEFAQEQMENDWFGDWYETAGEWYNPSDGWKTAGDIASGIGTSIPAIGASVGLTLASGGALAPLAATIVGGTASAVISGLGAAGNATKEAYRQTGELTGKEFGYGALVGTTEGAIDAVLTAVTSGAGRAVKAAASAVPKTGAKVGAKLGTEAAEAALKVAAKTGSEVGGEVAEAAVKTAAKETTKKGIGKLLKAGIKHVGKDFAGEAIEEGLAEVVAPYYARMTYDPNAKNATFEEILYAAFIGGTAGVIMGGGTTAVKGSATAVSNHRTGKTAVKNGYTNEILSVAKRVAEAEQASPSGYDLFENIAKEYRALMKSTGGGEVKTAVQKARLGALEKMTAVSRILPEVEKSAIEILNNPSTAARVYSTLGAVDANGVPLEITEAKLTEGLDLSALGSEDTVVSPKGQRHALRRAISQNPLLATLAIANATGNMILNIDNYASEAVAGNLLGGRAAYETFLERAGEEQKAALAAELGIAAPLDSVSYEDFSSAVARYNASSEGRQYVFDTLSFRKEVSAAAENNKAVPRVVGPTLKDGVHRYGGKDGIAIKKKGDAYRVYDYATQMFSKVMSREEVNAALQKHRSATAGKRYALPNGVDTHTKEQYNMREELYTAGDDFVRDVNLEDKEFARVLANETSDMVPGETRELIILGGSNSRKSRLYYFHADGYMHGYTRKVLWVSEAEARRRIKEFKEYESNYDREITDLWSESVRFERVDERRDLSYSGDRGATVDDDQVSRTARGGEVGGAGGPQYDGQDPGYHIPPPEEIARILKKLREIYNIPENNRRHALPGDTDIREGGQGNQAEMSQARDTEGRRYALPGDSKSYTAKQYNNYGWARANNVLTAGENEHYRRQFAAADKLGDKYRRTSGGELMIPVRDIRGATSSGIERKIVYAKGTIGNPVITRVLEIDLDNETELDKARRSVYDFERRGIQQKTGGIFRQYRPSDVSSYVAYKGNGDSGYGSGVKLGSNRGAGGGKTARTTQFVRTKENAHFPVKQTFKDISGVERAVLGLGEGKYAVYGTRVLREFSSPQDAIRAENENIIKGYARRYNKPLSFVRQKLLADPDFLVKTRKSDKRFALSEETDSREGVSVEKRTVERSATREELDAWAKENVKNYEKLVGNEQREIRTLIRQARALGIPDADIATYAAVSARSSVRITFSKERSYLGKGADGKDKYSDGFYDHKANEIVINPKGKRNMTRLVLHELCHRLYRNEENAKRIARIIADMLRDKNKARQSAVETAYGAIGATEDVILEEQVAHYAEDLLGNKHTLDRLMRDEPTLGDKILSFLGLAKTEYRGNVRLSRAAGKLYRHFEAAFRTSAAENVGNLAAETVTSTNGEHMQVSEDGKRYALSEHEYIENALKLQHMEAVAQIKGTEFDGVGSLAARVDEYFESIGGKVETDRFGTVLLNKASRRSDIGHGTTRLKILTYPVIPDVLKGGVVIDVRELPQAQKIVVAAPVSVGEFKNNLQKYFVGVMLFHDVNTKRVYLHDVVEEKEITLPTNEDTRAQTGPSDGRDNLYTTSILKKALNVKPITQETSSTRRYALPESAPDTTTVGKQRQRYKPSKADAFFTAKDRIYIETVDELHGATKYLRKFGGLAKADAEAKLQAARSARNQAQAMIGTVQYNVFSEKPTYMGEGLLEIYKPTRFWSEAKHLAFEEYLLHWLNVDRMTLESRSREWAAPLTAELTAIEGEIATLTESIKETKKAIRLKETAINNAKVRRGTVKTAAAKGRWQARLETLTGELSALESQAKQYEKDLRQKKRSRKAKKAELAPLLLKNKPVFGKSDTRDHDVTAEESRVIVKAHEKKYPEFASLAKKIYGYLDNLQEMRIAAGLTKRERVDYMKKLYPHYVPSYRDVQGGGASPVRGKNVMAVSTTLRRAKGGGQDILRIADSIAAQTDELMRAGHINLLASDIYDAAKASGDTAYVEILSDESVSEESDEADMSEEWRGKGAELSNFIEEVNRMVDKTKRSKRKKKIGVITKQHADLINSLMRSIDPEFSAEGYELWIDGTGAHHIERRHGKNGVADKSMASAEAKSRILWAAQNADTGEFLLNDGKIKRSDRFFNRDGTRAPEVKLEKHTHDGTIYVSECVPDSNNRIIWITSAYANQKGSKGQLLNMEDNSSPQLTPEASFDSNATTNSIPDSDAKINPSDEISSEADASTESLLRPKEGQITFYREGKPVTMRVSKELLMAFDGLRNQSVEFSNPLAKASAKVNTLFKRGVTSLNPGFMLRNPIRDAQDAGINTRHPAQFAKFYPTGIAAKEILSNSKDWQLYRAMGGFSSSVFEAGLKDMAGYAGFESLMGTFLSSRGDGTAFAKALKTAPAAVKTFFVGVENVNAFLEQVTRFAEFKASLAAGDSAAVALNNSAEVTTNFGRRGRLTKALNATIMPFLNPAVQGFDKIFRNVSDAVTGGHVVRGLSTLLVKVAIVGVLPMLFNTLMYDEDEDYKQLLENDKENNFLIKAADGSFIKIPRGRLAAVIGGLYNRSSKLVRGEDAELDTYLENVVTQVTPVENFTRTIFSPVFDMANNRTWYGGDIEGREFDDTAPRDRYDENTSSIAVALGQVFHYSPKKIHYLLDQYSGVVGDFVLPATTQKEHKDFFSGNFTLDTVTNNKLSTKFYDLYDKTQYAKTAGDEVAAYRLKYLNKVKQAVSEMNQDIDAIRGSDLSNAEKMQQVRVARSLINASYDSALTSVGAVDAAIRATAGIVDEDIRTAEINRRVFGAECALKWHSKAAYEKYAILNSAGIGYDELYVFYFSTLGVESDVDKNGNVIVGSKREKILAAINALEISPVQKMLLIASRGYALKDGDIKGVSAKEAETMLIRFLSSDRGASREQRGALAELCGYEVRNGRIVTSKK